MGRSIAGTKDRVEGLLRQLSGSSSEEEEAPQPRKQFVIMESDDELEEDDALQQQGLSPSSIVRRLSPSGWRSPTNNNSDASLNNERENDCVDDQAVEGLESMLAAFDAEEVVVDSNEISRGSDVDHGSSEQDDSEPILLDRLPAPKESPSEAVAIIEERNDDASIKTVEEDSAPAEHKEEALSDSSSPTTVPASGDESSVENVADEESSAESKNNNDAEHATDSPAQPQNKLLQMASPLFRRSWRRGSDGSSSVPATTDVRPDDKDDAAAIDDADKAAGRPTLPTTPLSRFSWRRQEGEPSPNNLLRQLAPPPIFQSLRAKSKTKLRDIESGDEAEGMSDDDDDKEDDELFERASKIPDESNDSDELERSNPKEGKVNWGPPIFSRLRRNRMQDSSEADATDSEDEKSAGEDEMAEDESPPCEPADPPIEGVFVKDDVDSKIIVCSQHPDNIMAQRRPFCSGVRVYHWTCPLCLKKVSDPQDFSAVVGDLLELYHRHYMEMEKSGVTQSRDLDRLQSELKNLKEEAGVARSMQELDMEYLDRLLVKTLPKMEMLWQDPPKKQEPILLGKLVSLRSDLYEIQEHVQKSACLKTGNSSAVAAASLRDVIQQMIVVLSDDRVMDLLEASEQGEVDAFTEEMMDWQDTLAVTLVTVQNHLELPETEADIEGLLVSLYAGEQAATAETIERDRLLRRRQRRFFRLPQLMRRKQQAAAGAVE